METLSNRLGKSQKWQELYILSRHWKTDLDFYLQDISFLERIIGKYVIWVRSEKNNFAVKNLLSDLEALKEEGRALNQELDDQLKILGSLLSGATPSVPEDLASKQESLEQHTSRFMKNFRRNRQEVYRVVEQVVDTENLSNHGGRME